MDLVPVHLDANSDQPLYMQLASQIRQAITRQALAPGQKLPPIRSLAQSLGVSNATIVSAYRLLDQDGHVVSQVGSGTFVAPPQRTSVKPWMTELDLPVDAGGGQILLPDNAINFATANPSPELFPVQEYKGLINEILDRDGGYAFTYQEGQGYFPLRQAVAAYFALQGLQTAPENMQVISGAQQGLDLISKALVAFGDSVAVENPTYPGAVAAFRSRNAKIIPIPMQADGLNLHALENQLKQHSIRLVYVTPNFQNPSGVTYSLEKRDKLLELARRYQFWIVEDDYASELRYAGAPVPPLKSMDRQQQVIYIKGFSKIMMPGLRIAFMVLPPKLVTAVASAKHSADISSGGLHQRVLQLYLDRGLWATHLAHIVSIYRQRYGVLLEEIEHRLGKLVKVHQPQGGLSLWMENRDSSVSGDRIYEAALTKGVAVVPGSMFYFDHEPVPFFRLCFAACQPSEIAAGLHLLAMAIQEKRPSTASSHLSPLV
ncbi:MAG: PLP-dependent aminotransferase family protein [Bacillota bacterium]